MILPIPTYLDVLDEARKWRSKDTTDDLKAAEKILREGLEEHHYALPLVDELALVLEKQGRDTETVELLQKQGERFKDAGEETLARLAKISKKMADRQIEHGNFAAADGHLVESERLYGLAFDKSKGFYPRINQLSVRFVRAGVLKVLQNAEDAVRLLGTVRDDAHAMLADPTLWLARKPDDNIWIPATQGEANVLVANWIAAESNYVEAIHEAAGKKFYHDSMRDQIKKLLKPAFQRLGIPFEGKLSTPDDFFALPTEVTK